MTSTFLYPQSAVVILPQAAPATTPEVGWLPEVVQLSHPPRAPQLIQGWVPQPITTPAPEIGWLTSVVQLSHPVRAPQLIQGWVPQPIETPVVATPEIGWLTEIVQINSPHPPAPQVMVWTPIPGGVTSRVGACYATFDWSMTQPLANGWSMTTGSATDYSICPE